MARSLGLARGKLPPEEANMDKDKDKTDQKRDQETGDWVSDLKPGATTEAKMDKGVEDTFPASDPVPKTGATGFISPDGEDTARSTPPGLESPGTVTGQNPAGQGIAGSARGMVEQATAYAEDALRQVDRAGRSATAVVSQQPLAALLIAGTVGWVLGLLASGRR